MLHGPASFKLSPEEVQYLRKELEAKERRTHIPQVVLDFHLQLKLVNWHYKNATSCTFNNKDTELVTEVPTSSISTKRGWKKSEIKWNIQQLSSFFMWGWFL